MEAVALVHPGWGSHGDAAPSDPARSTPGRLEINVAGATLGVPVYASRSLAASDDQVRRLVVVIQGDRRRAADYLDAAVAAAAAGSSDDALIVAPHLRVAADLAPSEQAGSALYWSTAGWKEGALSRVRPWGRPSRLSSFAVLDALISAVVESGRWRRLNGIRIVGHSAGGQFVQRYAAGSAIKDRLSVAGLRVRYVVANPSSYLYLSAERLDPITGEFRALGLDDLAACPGADDYKYGLRRLNEYMAASTRAAIRGRYRERSMTYVVGALDTDPRDTRFDTTCAAQLQGETRFARGVTFQASLEHLFGPGVRDRHRLVVVPEVGHDVRQILRAPEVRDALFGASPVAAMPAGSGVG
ncbi:MAG TPA: hypothetical protein VM451_05440 [Candidatus Limnocylindria bacterium]|nr:hypothetical protein [Candidatus Limnocylindria bacterium]